MHSEYQAFLASKALGAPMRGITHDIDMAEHLFGFQAHCVGHALRLGSAGCFLDTGLGKTEVQLEFSQHALEASNGHALIWTPLAVAQQTKRRAEKYGYEAHVIRDQSEMRDGINICNYDRRDRIDPDAYGAVSLDEASILKNFTGRTTRDMIAAFRHHRFKLVASATPAPNDHMEFGNYAEFLNIMAANEMLSRFFINDTSTASQQWRLKGHAVNAFWDWMASWSRMAEKPSDLGPFDDAGYLLPPLKIVRHRARDSRISDELADMFGAVTMSATTQHDVKRQTAEARAEKLAEVVHAQRHERWIIWCDTDYEADRLKTVLPEAMEVRGSMSIDEKEEKIEAFSTGQVDWLIGKASMLGFGLDWSHCARNAFVGRSYSFEQFYQAIRRTLRFGQTREVEAHIIVAEGEDDIGRVVDRKQSDHEKMRPAMRDAMRRAAMQTIGVKVPYNPSHSGRLPSWLKSAV